MPHMGDDPIVAAAALIGAIQTIVSRTINPQDEAVVTVTQMHGRNTWNIVPEEDVLRGPRRYFKAELHQILASALRRARAGAAALPPCSDPRRCSDPHPLPCHGPRPHPRS